MLVVVGRVMVPVFVRASIIPTSVKVLKVCPDIYTVSLFCHERIYGAWRARFIASAASNSWHPLIEVGLKYARDETDISLEIEYNLKKIAV